MKTIRKKSILHFEILFQNHIKHMKYIFFCRKDERSDKVLHILYIFCFRFNDKFFFFLYNNTKVPIM